MMLRIGWKTTTVLQENLVTDMNAATPEMLWDGCEDTRRNILFVCTGNTCRSPMAEVIFNFDYADSGYTAGSAGLMADGSSMSDNALDALFEEGYRVNGERASCQLTEDMMERADIVIGITASHAMQIVMLYPQYASKVYSMPFDIADPYGGSIEVYRACLADIKKALSIVAESI